MGGESIKLGLMVPLSGAAEAYGTEILRAACKARDEVNGAGGILGYPLEMVMVDDGSRTETAIAAAESLVDTFGCVALLGNVLSNTRIAVSQLVSEPRRIPLLGYSLNEGSLSSPLFYSFGALPNQQLGAALPYVVETLGPKVFFVGSNHEWPRGAIAAAAAILRSAGGELVGEVYTDDMAEIGGTLDRLARSGADVFVPVFAGQRQIELLRQLHRHGQASRTAVLAGHLTESLSRFLSPEARHGLYAVNSYFMTLGTPRNRDWLAGLRNMPETSGLAPRGGTPMSHFGESAYIAIHAFAWAANRTGETDGEIIAEALAGFEMTAPQGHVRMDPNTRNLVVNSYLGRCRADGMFNILRAFGSIRPQVPDRYLADARKGAASMLRTAKPGPTATRPAALPIAIIEPDGTVGHANRAFRALWVGDMVRTGMLARDLWADPQAFERLCREIADAGTERSATLKAGNLDGTTLSLTCTLDPVGGDDSAPRRVVLVCSAPRLPDSDPAHLDQILSVADVAVIATDEDGIIQHVNAGATEMFGYSRPSMLGLSVHMLLPPQMRDRHRRLLGSFLQAEEREALMSQRRDVMGYRQNGSTFPAEASLAKFMVNGKRILVATLRDISERKRHEDELLRRATHDPMTGLPNRHLFRKRLSNALKRWRNTGGDPVTLFMIDLDRFKVINDTAGHRLGDRLLKNVADRLMELAGRGRTFAHLGADEFALICEQPHDLGDLAGLAGRLVDALRQPFELDDRLFGIAASVGFARNQDAGTGADDLIRDATTAMRDAKARGGNGWRFFSEDLEEASRRQLRIIEGLDLALDRRELNILYQPIVSTWDGTIVGAETLLRWTPEFGQVGPDQFVPIAESTGAILRIGRWVFEQACATEVRLREAFGDAAPYLTVNISVRQLIDPDLVSDFNAAIIDRGADPQRIVLELTETSLTVDADSDLNVLDRLCDLGLRIAIDDFGTGYSSLLQLLRLPISTVKIDREFIDGMDRRRDSRLITRTITKMAKELGKDLVAEGVETRAQLEQLRNMGCDRVQGYLFYRPLTEPDLFQALRNKPTARLAPALELRYLIYISQARRPLGRDDLVRILDASRQFNARNGITGFLVYRHGRFMQMLEGPVETVDELMDRIVRDDRHRDVRMVVHGLTRRRLFPDWSMGFRDMETLDGDFPGFEAWRQGTADLLEWADDARICFDLFEALSICGHDPESGPVRRSAAKS